MTDYCDYGPDDRRFHDNEVHTILYISGTKEGKENAKQWLEDTGKKGLNAGEGFELFFKNLMFHEDGENIWTEIVIDNAIPQIYEDLAKLPGVNNVIWASYADYYINLLTNDAERIILSRLSLFGIPDDRVPEIYDPLIEDDYYPDIYELAHFRENLPD